MVSSPEVVFVQIAKIGAMMRVILAGTSGETGTLSIVFDDVIGESTKRSIEIRFACTVRKPALSISIARIRRRVNRFGHLAKLSFDVVEMLFACGETRTEHIVEVKVLPRHSCEFVLNLFL
jgi:hypothetical protein